MFARVLSGPRLWGAALVLAGVVVAIGYARRPGTHILEQVFGPLWLAVGLGLLAGLCQSLGTLLAKPVMSQGVRSGGGILRAYGLRLGAHLVLRWSRAHCPAWIPSRPILGIVASGFLAMTLGMTLILMALGGSEVGMVAILSSTTPVMLCRCCGSIPDSVRRSRPGAPHALVVAGTAWCSAAESERKTPDAVPLEGRDFGSGQSPVFAGSQFGSQHQLANLFPMQTQHLVANGGKHPLDLMVLAFMNRQQRLGRGDQRIRPAGQARSPRNCTPSAKRAIADGSTGSASRPGRCCHTV